MLLLPLMMMKMMTMTWTNNHTHNIHIYSCRHRSTDIRWLRTASTWWLFHRIIVTTIINNIIGSSLKTVEQLQSRFPRYFGGEIQGLFKDFQVPWSCIFKDQFSTEVYSMDSITANFNICFCDYGTVLVDKNKTWQLLANLVSGKIPDRFLSK